MRSAIRLPALKGQLLTGRTAVLPRASSGKVTLVAMGFTYKSRVPVEAWADWYRTTIGSRTDVTFFEVPMIGGLATLAGGSSTEACAAARPQSSTITSSRSMEARATGSSGSPIPRSHEDDAYLIVLDRQGVVRWLHHGVFDQSRADELRGLLTSLADGHPVTADPDPADRRREP